MSSVKSIDIIDHCFPYPEEEEFDVSKFRMLEGTDLFTFVDEKTGLRPNWVDITDFTVEKAKEAVAQSLERRRVSELRRFEFIGAPDDVTLPTLCKLRHTTVEKWNYELPFVHRDTRILEQTSLAEKYDLRIPDEIIRTYLNRDGRNKAETLKRSGVLKKFLRLYRFMNNVIGPPKGSHTINKEERILLPEEWVQRFVGDPWMNSIGVRILLRPNIVYDIIKYILPALAGTHPAVRVPSTEVCDDEAKGCATLPNERLFITACVDDVQVLSDNSVLNEFLIVFDSGCTTHTFNTLTYLDNYKVCKGSNCRMSLAKKNLTVPILGYGTCKELGNVLYVPVVEYCLISIRQLDDQGFEVRFSQGYARVINRKSLRILLTASIDRKLNLYTINQSDFEKQMGFTHRACMAHSMKTDKISRLHYIFNHASAERIRYLCKCNSFPSLENVTVKQCEHIKDCEFCRMAKIHKKPCCKTVERHPVLGQVWNGDTKGPISTPSLKYENHYVFGLIESKSRFLIQYFIKNKDDVLKVAYQWVNTYIRPLRAAYPNLGMIFVHTDNGEFNSKEMHDFLI